MTKYIELLKAINKFDLKDSFITDFKTKLKDKIIDNLLHEEEENIKISVIKTETDLQKLQKERDGDKCSKCDKRNDNCWCN